MVGRSGKMTAAVSIHEEKNTELEIPRIDPKDKPKLWISRVEIHHNTMMEKIRVLVQEKLFELVATDDSFFAGIDDFTIENDDDDSLHEEEQKPESKEEILLTKKARFMKEMLREIMELPKDDIIDFLTSSSLPTGLNRSSKISKRNQPKQEGIRSEEQGSSKTVENSPIDTSVTNSKTKKLSFDSQDAMPIQEEDDDGNYDYNWIQDSTDAWKDLPPVVRINAMELGYTERLWDEDSQDIPAYRIFWMELTPNQRTAAIFLGNYDERTWDAEVRMLLMAEKNPSLASISDDDASDEGIVVNVQFSSEISTGTSTRDRDASKDSIMKSITEMLEDDDDEDDDDDDDELFNAFVSNFVSEANEEEEEESDVDFPDDANAQNPQDDVRPSDEYVAGAARAASKEDEDDDDMMDEFLSNFVEPVENKDDESDYRNKISPENKSLVPAAASAVPKDKDAEDTMMDEFLSNFVEPTKEAMQQDNEIDDIIKNCPENEGIVLSTAIVVPKNEDEDEDAMIDEFLLNFVEPTQEEVQYDGDADDIIKISPENEIVIPPTASVVPKNKNDDEGAMMNELLSNFVEPTQEEVQQEDKSASSNRSNPGNESIGPPIASVVPKDEEDDEDAMMDEFLSNFVEPKSSEEVQQDNTNDINNKNSSAIEFVVPPAASVFQKDNIDGAAMMNESLSNSVVTNNKEKKIEIDDLERRSEDSLVGAPINSDVAEDKNDDDGDEAAMDEFLSNFVEPTQNLLASSETELLPVYSESHIIPNYDSVRDNTRKDDEEQPLINTPRISIMERGFQGERSPLLPSSTTVTSRTREETKSEIEKPDPEESSSWYSSFLYWVPFVVAAPVVYMVVAAHQPKN